jgi:acyl-CoA thioesterase I
MRGAAVGRAAVGHRVPRWASALFASWLLTAAACQRATTDSGDVGAAGAGSAASNVAAGGPSIVFLGDSLTAGFGLSEGEALPALIQQKIEAGHLPFRVINAGRSGDTTAGGLARIDWYLKESLDLRVVVIGLGSNDAMRGLPLETMERNLRQIIARVRERKPSAKIFLWELRTFPNLGQAYADDYAAVFPRVAEAEAVTLIPFPLEAVAARPELNQGDGIHPNAEGTRAVAERVWASLAPQL